MQNLNKITCIEDLRKIAKRRVPRMFYDYVDTGSWTKGTYRANTDAFAKILLRQKVGHNLENRSTTTNFGVPYTLSTVSICSLEDVSQAINGRGAPLSST